MKRDTLTTLLFAACFTPGLACTSSSVGKRESPEATSKKNVGGAAKTELGGEAGHKPKTAVPGKSKFVWATEQIGDVQILRYQIPGFKTLNLPQKKLAYYLYEAAQSGRDIIYDQKYKHNLAIRRTVEAVLRSYKGDPTDSEFKKLTTYAKKIWFARGVHHDYSGKKFTPSFGKAWFGEQVKACRAADLPLLDGEGADALLRKLDAPIFDAHTDAKRVNRDAGVDVIAGSANNFYENVSQKEVETFYSRRIDAKNLRQVSWGLNSKLVKENGKLVEKTWKVGGMYGTAIEKIVGWLEKASGVAENAKQKKSIDLLIAFYKTGDLKKFDEYSVAWVADVDSRIDFINGFIEVYGDAAGYRGTFESVVSIKDLEASKRIASIAKSAQWFEDNSPIAAAHKKKKVVGISAKVIEVVTESGDASPSTPIGINLPNSAWIRAAHGSKSVALGNIVHAYEEASKGNGRVEEFAFSKEEIARANKYSSLAQTLKVDMHEVIGHASGQINSGVGTTKETLKSYASALEEGRADLVALYFIMDRKLVALGLMPNLDVGKTAYDGYVRNGLLVQLARLDRGANVEESHMRNRQMIAAWALEKGKKDNVIERLSRDGKTFFRINDYDKLRTLFGELLHEIQRIKSEGDYKAGKALIETYGVKVDAKLHAEVLDRYAKLGVMPYKGFINPRLVPVTKGTGIVDVRVEYPDDFMTQQLEYAESYSFLPHYN
ncbi:MAG: dihydrofolate reductase [Nannocystaceae bacterium]